MLKRLFSASRLPTVKKGVVVMQSGNEYQVRLENKFKEEPRIISAKLHDKCQAVTLQSDSPVFVFEESAEIVAYGIVNHPDNRMIFTRCTCIHPERTDESKYCKTCPERSN